MYFRVTMDLLRTLFESIKKNKDNLFWFILPLLWGKKEKMGAWVINFLNTLVFFFLFYLTFVHQDVLQMLIQTKDFFIRITTGLFILLTVGLVQFRLKLHDWGIMKLSEGVLLKLFGIIVMFALLRILPKIMAKTPIVETERLNPSS